MSTTTRMTDEQGELMRRAIGIYERKHYFPGSAPATRDQIINEIYKGLLEIHEGKSESVIWDDDC